MKDITCETALDRMLEAAPAELRGRADTGLAAHIAGCHRCAAVAAAMLDGLGAVDDALAEYATGGPAFAAGSDPAADSATPERDAGPHAGPHAAADAAADAALAAIRKEDGDGVVSLEGRRRTEPDGDPATREPTSGAGAHRRRWLRAAWVPLAAAAVLATVLVFGRDDPFTAPGTGTARPPEPVLEPRIAVTPPADKAAAIMETENPNITIVWLYEREES